jgi:hypothetical protein
MTNSILDPKFALDILIRVAILFTILSVFFSKVISNLSANTINKELEHIIKDSFKPGKLYKEKLLKKFNELKDTVSVDDSRLKNIKFLLAKVTGENNLPSFPIELFKNLGDKSDTSFDYYLKLFSNEDRTRLKVNNELFDKIKIANILIVAFTIIISSLFIYNNIILFDDFKNILLNGTITFIFVGIIEVLFFLNIGLKFIPTSPSLIFKSFVESMKDQFKNIN